MIKYYCVIIIFLFCASFSFAQDVTYDNVKKQYETFQYDNVIKFSGQLIQRGILSDSLKIELYLMRANIFYSRNDDQATRNSFEEILKIQKKYVPDPSNISSKLITIFNEVKVEYMRKNPDIVQLPDSTQIKREIKFADPLIMWNARIRNIIPGLGELYLGYKTKGWIETALSAVNLGALIYFHLDTNKKEKDYLNETNNLLIQQKYDDYNKSYKIRTALLVSYAALFVISQIDLTFFSNEPQLGVSLQEKTLINSPVSMNSLQLNFRIHF
jgi:hypothetical protein